MPTRRLQAVAALVFALGLLQIFVEDVIVFFGATRTGSGGLLASRYFTMGVPLVISLLLVAILIGGAIVHADSL